MDNLHIANEWFEVAGMDISSAKYLQTMHPVPIEIICYHCLQFPDFVNRINFKISFNKFANLV